MEPSTMMPAPRGNQPKNLAEEPLDSLHILACPRRPYEDVRREVESCGKAKWMANIVLKSPLSCCRDPGNYDIEAWFSTPLERDKASPDLYKFHCRVCEARVASGAPDERGIIHDGTTKVAWCLGGGDFRPTWE